MFDPSSYTQLVAHQTKDKGDLGVAKAHADLVAQGYTVLFPATEHAPFDLAAYRDGVFERVQVKFRSARSGKVEVAFRSSWADRNGTHERPIDKSQIDVICMYCPETDECYYVRPAFHRSSVALRVTPSRNGQRTGILLAGAFRSMPRPRAG